MKILFTVIWIFSLLCPAFADDIYLAQSAAGNGNGTSCTNARAYTYFDSNAACGNTYHVCGTISGPGSGSPAFTVPVSCTVDAKLFIVFESGASLTAPYWGTTGAIYINGKNYIVVDGSVGGLGPPCGYVGSGAGGTLVNCNGEIKNTDNGALAEPNCDPSWPGYANQQQSTGIRIEGGSTNVEIKNLTIKDIYKNNGKYVCSLDRAAFGNTIGVNISAGPSANISVHNCDVYEAFAGIYAGTLGSDGDSIYLYNNAIHSHSWGFFSGADLGYNLSNVQIYNSKIYDYQNWQCPAVSRYCSFGATAWYSGTTYSALAFVQYTDDLFYVSKQSGNQGHIPSSSPDWWYIPPTWTSTMTYNLNDVVFQNTDYYYISLQNTNLNNQPSSSPTYWKIVNEWNSGVAYKSGNYVHYPGGNYFYYSKVDNNINHLPTDSDYWAPGPPDTYHTDGLITYSKPKAGGSVHNIVYNNYFYENMGRGSVTSPLFATHGGNDPFWDADTTYSVGNVVILSLYATTGTAWGAYVSLVNSNKGNPPASTPAKWALVNDYYASQIIAFNNIFFRTGIPFYFGGYSANCIMLNNTIIQGPGRTGGGAGVQSEGPGGIFKNNIVKDVGRFLLGGTWFLPTIYINSDYNSVWNVNDCEVEECYQCSSWISSGTEASHYGCMNPGNPATSWQLATGNDTHSVLPPVDPNLNSNYVPNLGSSVIGAGINLSSYCIANGGTLPNALCSDASGKARPLAGAWDIGAYQYGAGSPDTTPPVISSPLPTGVQTCTSSPRNVTIQLTTDENATCKYSSSDQAYDSMPSTYGTGTGTTSHSQSLVLTCGASYNYYSRCMDSLGNKDLSSALTAFSIASAGVAVPKVSGGQVKGGNF